MGSLSRHDLNARLRQKFGCRCWPEKPQQSIEILNFKFRRELMETILVLLKKDCTDVGRFGCGYRTNLL